MKFYEQTPLKDFFLLTIYQNYTQALSINDHNFLIIFSEIFFIFSISLVLTWLCVCHCIKVRMSPLLMLPTPPHSIPF